ncbi:hypothetical protein Moror_11233 [Moniliophthora roreri MCA 2997]|uniref:Uncharacterized protein n=2 Tax=Moniliophthora roreri TaxID=221103 RepID=V2WR00_MONRO|nr:hypothetical protein Moror_11233 [Moniliophthora roreri MCA 2997]KAI3606060.1 hypothetical protein WG66_003964 [Moniliophthora roreri]
MPAFRRKMCCAFAEDKPKPKRASKPRPVLTPEEKADKMIQRELNRIMREKKKEWEATLVPAVVDESFRWPVNTKGLYPSEAKSLYKLTPKEIQTLKAEHIAASPKSFVRLEDVTALTRRKHEALNKDTGEPLVEIPWYMVSCLHTKLQDNGRRTKTNWTGTTSSYSRRWY